MNFLCGHLFDQANVNLELEKLRIELRHAQGMHAVAQSENIDVSRKVIYLFSYGLKHFISSLSLLFLLLTKYNLFMEPLPPVMLQVPSYFGYPFLLYLPSINDTL